MSTAAAPSRQGGRLSGAVPLAWRNLLANKPRLVRSSGGIGFAVLLMLMQLGFNAAFFNASLELIRRFDGAIFLESASKYRFATSDPFPSKVLDKARGVPGVATVAPLYADWLDIFWKNPFDGKNFRVRVLAFDPDRPVLRLPAVEGDLAALREPNAVLVDRRARRFMGMDRGAKEAALNGNPVHIVGSFALGPDFENDGTVVVSDATFGKLLPNPAGGPPAVELGVVRLAPGSDLAAVQQALSKALPAGIAVLTKPQLLELERKFQADVSSAGPIFVMGTLVGFIVGLLISYQIIFTDLSEQLPQYATMKAMGYRSRYLVRVVLEQASLSALAGWVPAWLAALLLFRVIGGIALLPLRMTAWITVSSLALTLGMCLISAVLAVRRVLAADPAEVF
jgi:putative ABC transport system permease protein